MHLRIICTTVAHDNSVSSSNETEFDLHVDTCALGNNCFTIHGHNSAVNAYNYDQKDRHNINKTVDVEWDMISHNMSKLITTLVVLNSLTMATPQNLLESGSIQRNDYKNIISI